MRRAILLFAALIGGFTAGCGSEPPAAPRPAAPHTPANLARPVVGSRIAPGETAAAGSAIPAGRGLPSRSIVASPAPRLRGPRPIGSGQDIRTRDLAARITVARSVAAADQYIVRVTVHVLRGTYEFGPALVRLRHTAGPDDTPPAAGAIPPVAFTLHVGVTQTWRIPFRPPTTGDTQIQVTESSGAVLATWTTR
ncbi:hypothetical protein [Actinoplanes siamensis]|nr:hypothetical protein [Actinoplanes siamensis]